MADDARPSAWVADLAERVRSTHRAYLARTTSADRRDRFGQTLKAYRDALLDTRGLDPRAPLGNVLLIAQGMVTVADVNQQFEDSNQGQDQGLGLGDIVPIDVHTTVDAEDDRVLVTATDRDNGLRTYTVMSRDSAVTLMQHLADELGFDLRRKG